MPGLESVGGVIGTSVSALFLYAIAAINIVVLVDVYRTFRHVRRGGTYSDAALDGSLEKRGLWCRLFGPMMRLIGASWQMYPLGVLFGLGFDTATEVGILGIAALEAAKGLPVYTIMVFPLLFTVGMCLLDTTDGVLMLGCYGWALRQAGTQALLQYEHHAGVGARGHSRRHDRSAEYHRSAARFAGRAVECGRPRERQLRR